MRTNSGRPVMQKRRLQKLRWRMRAVVVLPSHGYCLQYLQRVSRHDVICSSSPYSHIGDSNKGEQVAYSANHYHCQGVCHEHWPLFKLWIWFGTDKDRPELSHVRIVTADVLANAWISALIVLTAMKAEFTLIAPPTCFLLIGFTRPTILLIRTDTGPPCDRIATSCFIFLTVAQLILLVNFRGIHWIKGFLWSSTILIFIEAQFTFTHIGTCPCIPLAVCKTGCQNNPQKEL